MTLTLTLTRTQTLTLTPTPCTGILALYDERLRDRFDMKIFVDADPDVRLARRIRRDMAERGRDLDGVLQQCADLPPPTLTTPTTPPPLTLTSTCGPGPRGEPG